MHSAGPKKRDYPNVAIGTDGGSGSSPVIFSGTLNLGRATTLRGGSSDRTTITGKVSGNVGTLSIASGRVTLDNAANDYVGDTVVNAGGILQLNAAGVLPDATNLTVNGNLYFNNTAETVASLTGSGNIQVHPSVTGTHTLTVSGSSNTTYAGTMQNGGGVLALTKSGSGTLTVSGAISSSGALTVSGGTLSLTAANTFSGNVTVSNGTLSITGGGRIYSGTHRTSIVTVNSGGVLELEKWDYNLAGESLGGLQANASSIVLNGGTVRIVGTTATSYGRGVTINSGGATFEAAAGANWTLASDIAFALSGNPSITLSGAGTGTLAKVFSGTGGITKSGAGTWTLSGANTHSGATTVNGGVLVISGTFAASSAITVNDGGTLRLGNSDRFGNHATTTSPVLTLNAGSKLQTNGFFNTLVNATLAGGTIDLTGGASASFPALALKGTVTVSGSQASAINAVSGSNNRILIGTNSAGGATIFSVADVASGVDLTVAAGLSNNRAVPSPYAEVASGLTKTGAGTMVLDAANTYTGATTVNAGVLRLGASGSLSASTGLSVAAGATFDLNGRSQQVATLDGAGAVTLGAGTLTVSGSANSTFAGSLAGAGALVKSGSGTLSLLTALAHTGGTTLAEGTLELGSSDVFGASSSLSIQGGTLDLGLNEASVGALAIAGGTVTGLGTLTATSITASNASGSILIEAVLASSGQLTKTGAGILDVRSALSLAGGLRVSEGTVTLASGGSLGAEDAVLIDGGTLNLGAASLTVGSLSLSAGSLLGTGTLTASAYDFANTSTLEVAVTLAGDAALTKTGAGTLVLSGANTFTGGLTVNGGQVVAESLESLGSGTVNLGQSGELRLDLTLLGDLDLSSVLGGISGTGVLELNIDGINPVSLGAGSTFGGTVRVASGVFDSDGFGGNVIFAGGQLLNPESFTGITTVTGAITDVSQLPTGGTLVLESGASIDFGSTPFAGAITYRGGSVSGAGFTGTLNVEGTNVAISGSFGNGKLSVGAGSSVVLSGATSGTIVFAGGDITGGANLTGTLELGSGRSLVIGQGLDVFGNGATLALSSGSSLNLSGSTSAGNITFAGGSLSGAQAFTGTIGVTSGATFSTNEIVGGTVTLASGTTLAGNGTFTGTVTAAAGAILAPGSSPGLTTYGTLSLTGGTILQFEFFSTEETLLVGDEIERGYDTLVADTVNFGTAGTPGGGRITLQLATLANWSDSVANWNGAEGFTPAEGSSLIHTVPGLAKDFVLARFGDSDRTLSDGLNVTSWFAFDTDLYVGTGASSFQMFTFQNGDNWELTMRVVPEPSTYGLILGALSLAAAAARRRRKKTD